MIRPLKEPKPAQPRPSETLIAERAALIRAGWNETTHLARLAVKPSSPWSAPIVSVTNEEASELHE